MKTLNCALCHDFLCVIVQIHKKICTKMAIAFILVRLVFLAVELKLEFRIVNLHSYLKCWCHRKNFEFLNFEF